MLCILSPFYPYNIPSPPKSSLRKEPAELYDAYSNDILLINYVFTQVCTPTVRVCTSFLPYGKGGFRMKHKMGEKMLKWVESCLMEQVNSCKFLLYANFLCIFLTVRNLNPKTFSQLCYYHVFPNLHLFVGILNTYLFCEMRSSFFFSWNFTNLELEILRRF